MAAECVADGIEHMDGPHKDFARYAQLCVDQEAGRVSAGKVPQTNFWLVDDGRILGTCRVRHGLSESLWCDGGHIGYDVRPSARNRGHGTKLLAMALEEARAMGHPWVLITIEEDNLASIRVTEKNGGTAIGRVPGTTVRRFVIRTADRVA